MSLVVEVVRSGFVESTHQVRMLTMDAAGEPVEAHGAVHVPASPRSAMKPLQAVGMLRAAGLPARYVSGYLHPKPDAEIGEPVEGQSHAWVEYWAGEWLPLDPTNGSPVGEAHVVVARGRDYSDVPPLKGVYQGPGESRQEITVTVARPRG